MKPKLLVMKALNLIVISTFTFLVMVQPAASKTTFRGKVLSVDGTPIPKAAVSIQPEIRRDIFSGHFEDIIAGEDGSYQFQIDEPGLYRIYFKGVFHHEISLPVMVYDQPSVTMNILLMPKYFNDGFYFSEDNYTEWIRIYGNFNEYNYNTGKKFSLNTDGSISAFVPVNSDTIRYQVRGLTYGRGISVLAQADEFQLRGDGSFEAVLYNNLPKDSLEIRYEPGKTIPFTRNLPEEVNPQEIILGGFVSLQNQEDENWIRPLSILQPYNTTFEFTDWKLSSGIPIQKQNEVQEKFAGSRLTIRFKETLELITSELDSSNLHEQQSALLSMSYASVLGWMARRIQIQEMRKEQPILLNAQLEDQIHKVEHDPEIILSIPETVPPYHPAWRYNNGAVDYLLTETEDTRKFVDYFLEAVEVHPDERAVYVIAISMVRLFSPDYALVEEMPVYQLIVDRYGEGDLARNAQQAFIAGARN